MQMILAVCGGSAGFMHGPHQVVCPDISASWRLSFSASLKDEKFKPALFRRQFITSRFKIASSRPSSVPKQAVPGSKCNDRSQDDKSES